MLRLCILLLRACLTLLVLAVGLLQFTVVPVLSIEIARESAAPSARYVYPLAGLICWACLCAVALSAWALLSRVRPRTVLAAPSVRWVDVAVIAGLVATATCFSMALFAYLVVEPPLDAPGIVVLALIALSLTGAFTLSAVVARAVLRDAVALVGGDRRGTAPAAA